MDAADYAPACWRTTAQQSDVMSCCTLVVTTPARTVRTIVRPYDYLQPMAKLHLRRFVLALLRKIHAHALR